MRILILSPFFYPEPISTGRYNTVLATGLADAGAEVTVICSHPLYPAWRPQYSEAQLPGVEILRGGHSLRYPQRPFLRRALLEIWFALFTTFKTWRRGKNVDLVVAIFPPSLYFAVVSVLLPRRVRRVGIVHDLQGVHAAASGSLPARLISGLIRLVERRAFAACDKLIVLSSAMVQQLSNSMRIEAGRISVCYPFVNLPEGQECRRRLEHQFPAKLTHVVYSGALGEKQNPAGLGRIIEKLVADLPSVKVHIFSEGPSFEQLKGQLASLATERISFQPLVDEADVAELYRRADIQLIPQAAGTQHGSMPSKLPNILAGGGTILAICDADSELAEIVSRFRAGECVHSWEPEAVALAAARLVRQVQEGIAPVPDGQMAREYFSLDRLLAAITGQDSLRP